MLFAMLVHWIRVGSEVRTLLEQFGEENEAYRRRIVPTTKRQFWWHIGDRAIVDEPNETRNKACPNRDEVVEVVSFLGNGKVVVIGRTSRKDRVVALSQLRRAYFL